MKTLPIRVCLGLISVCLAGLAVAAEPAKSPELPGLQEFVQSYTAAFNSGDAKKLAAFWATDAELVDSQGAAIEGRKAIEESFAAALAKHPGGKLTVKVLDVKPIKDVMAIVDIIPTITPPRPGQPTEVHAVLILEKTPTGWLINSARDAVFLAASAEHLNSLDWLVGQWRGSVEGDKPVALNFRCHWTGNHSFLVRIYTITVGDVRHHGQEIIGWDADKKTVRSWLFDVTGAFAERTWNPTKDGWNIDHVATNPDGSKSSVADNITKIDADSFKVEWLTPGKPGEKPQQQFVVLKRVKNEPETPGAKTSILPK